MEFLLAASGADPAPDIASTMAGLAIDDLRYAARQLTAIASSQRVSDDSGAQTPTSLAGGSDSDSDGSAPAPQRRGSGSSARRGAPQAFAKKLWDMLLKGNSDTVSWSSDKCFVIHDRDRFAAEVLPLYFRHGRYPSFQRQLNLYGFKQVPKGPSAGAYTHPHFIRHRLDLLPSVRRGAQKKTGGKAAAEPAAGGRPRSASVSLTAGSAAAAAGKPRRPRRNSMAL